MKKDKSRDHKKSGFERDVKIKKVHTQKQNKTQWKRFFEEEDFDE